VAGIFLEGGFLRSILEHPGDLAGYGRRRLGSGLEDEETVWEATYGYRLSDGGACGRHRSNPASTRLPLGRGLSLSCDAKKLPNRVLKRAAPASFNVCPYETVPSSSPLARSSKNCSSTCLIPAGR
jgi:hypothetical protein